MTSNLAAVLEKPGDAILGTELQPVDVGDASASLSDAVARAVKVWAPGALVKSVRLAAPDPVRIPSSVLSGRVYARQMGDGGEVVLQVTAGKGERNAMSATVILRLPFARD